MRRSDREITDPGKIEALIAGEQLLRVGFYHRGEIYIVPVNYGYTFVDGKYSFYFHGAGAGRKFELSRSNPSVGFEIDGSYRLLEAESACHFSASFQSVIGTGTVQLVEDREEKVKGLHTIMRQSTKKAEWEYREEMLEAVAVFRLDVTQISCKAK